MAAVVVEEGYGVVEEVDGKGRRRQSVGGGIFEELEDAEAVDPLGTGVNEEVAALEVGAEGRPKVVGGELLSEEGGHGGLEVAGVKGWEEVVSRLDCGKALVGIERVAILHRRNALGNGRTCAKGDARGDSPLRTHYHVVATIGFSELAHNVSCLGKFLEQVEVFATLQGCNATDAAI